MPHSAPVHRKWVLGILLVGSVLLVHYEMQTGGASRRLGLTLLTSNDDARSGQPVEQGVQGDVVSPERRVNSQAPPPKAKEATKQLKPGQRADSDPEYWDEEHGMDLTEAFITFSDSKRFDLVEVLLDSVHEFSTRPIVVMGIGIMPPFSKTKYPRMIAKTMTPAPRSIYFNKLKAILSNKIKYGILVESDDIVNWSIDSFFKVVRDHAKEYPLLPRHPQSTMLTRTYATGSYNKPPVLPYGHAHVLWSYRTIPFLKRTWEDSIKQGGPPHDELALNYRLWKEQAPVQACIYDPYKDRHHYYVNQKWPPGQWDSVRESGFPGSDVLVAFHLIHGDKKANEAKETLKTLIKHKGKPVYTNGTHWGHKASDFKSQQGVVC